MMQEDDTALTIARSISSSYILTLEHCRFGKRLESGIGEAFYASEVSMLKTFEVQWDRAEGEV